MKHVIPPHFPVIDRGADMQHDERRENPCHDLMRCLEDLLQIAVARSHDRRHAHETALIDIRCNTMRVRDECMTPSPNSRWDRAPSMAIPARICLQVQL